MGDGAPLEPFISEYRPKGDGFLLPPSLRCIHPKLRANIETNDRAALLAASELLLAHCTWITQADSSSATATDACGSNAPFSRHATQHDADEELYRRCRYLMLAFVDLRDDNYVLPDDLLRRLVPFLYNCVVDWELLLRHTTCWETLAKCFCRVATSRRRHRFTRPMFTLPWCPLVSLLKSLFFQPARVMDLHAFHGMRSVAMGQLERVCEVSSQHFDVDAWPGLWEDFAPYFSPQCEEAALMLCLFSHLLPVHRLVDDVTNEPVETTERVLRFLLVDSVYWQQHSSNWLMYSLKIIFKMAIFHVGVADFDRYAEPLFSMMLFDLRLPINDPTGAPRRVFRTGFGMLGKFQFFKVDAHEMPNAMGCIANLLPNRTDSPLWNHLRRFIPATSVFLRPNATDQNALTKVFSFYASLVASAHRRMKGQAAFLRAQSHPALRAAHKNAFSRSIPEAYIWSRETIDCFVDLVAPVLLSSLHHRLSDAPRVIGLLAALSPAKVQKMILPYIDMGLLSHVESPQQRQVALQLLTRAIYPLSESIATREECWTYLANALPHLLLWVNPSVSSLSSSVLDLVFAVCTITGLKHLFGSEDAECKFAVILVEHLFEYSNHVKCDHPANVQLAHVMWALCANLSESAFQCCLDRALREAETQGSSEKASAVGLLLEPIARRAPESVMRWASRSLMPLIQNIATADNELVWCVHVLDGCVRGAGLSVFRQRHELMRCVQCLLSQVTRRRCLLGAATLYAAIFSAFSSTSCTGGPSVFKKCLDEKTNTPIQDGKRVEKNAEAGIIGCEEDNFAEEDDSDNSEEALDTAPENVSGVLSGNTTFCRATSVRLTWLEPTEEHIGFLLDTYNGFMQEMIDVIRSIELVLPPSEENSFLGLSALIDSSRRGTNRAEATGSSVTNENDISSPSSSDVESVTPSNVLRAVILWMRYVVYINHELRTQCEKDNKLNCMPWWTLSPRTVWTLPLNTEPTIAWPADALSDFLFEHVLRRLASGSAPCGTTAEALQLQESPLMKGLPPFGDTEEVDTSSLQSLLWILAEQCNMDLPGVAALPEYQVRDRLLNRFEHIVAGMLQGRHYLPVMYWQVRAECYTFSRRGLTMFQVPPRRLRRLINVTHILLFSPYSSLQAQCGGILITSMDILSRLEAEKFVMHNLIVLGRIASLWNSTHKDGEDGFKNRLLENYGRVDKNEEGYDEDGVKVHDGHENVTNDANSTNLLSRINSDDDHKNNNNNNNNNTKSIHHSSSSDDNKDNKNYGNREKEMEEKETENDEDDVRGTEDLANSSRLKRELATAFSLTFSGFSSHHFYYNADVIRRTYELIVQFPEELTLKRVGNLRNVHETASFSGISTMEYSHAARLSDDLLALAARYALAAPGRVLGCLMMIVALYRPSRTALLSRHSVSLLFRFTTNNHAKVRETSFHILQILFLSLKEPRAKTYVRMRRGKLESDGDVEFFRHRYNVIRRECASFYGLRGAGLTFAPRAVSLDAVDTESIAFQDREPVPLEDNVGLLRQPYLDYTRNTYDKTNTSTMRENDTDLCCQREELIELIRNLSGFGMESSDAGTPFSDDHHGKADPHHQEGIEKDEDDAEKRQREGWIWSVMQQRNDQQVFSQSRMRMWKTLGKLLGVSSTVTFFNSIVRLKLCDYVRLARSEEAAAKESPSWLFACLADMQVSSVRMSKRDPEARREALSCYIETLLFVCTSSLVPNEASSAFVGSVSALPGTLKPEEVWTLYQALFAALGPSSTPSTSVLFPKQTPSASVTTDEREGEKDICGISSTTHYSLKTQEISRVLVVLVYLLAGFAEEANVELLPRLTQQILLNKALFLNSDSTNARRFCASVIRQIIYLVLQQSPFLPSHATVQSDVETFLEQFAGVEALPPLPSASPRPVLAPWSATPALFAASSPLCASNACSPGMGAVDADGAVVLPPALRLEAPEGGETFQLDSTLSSMAGLSAVKTIAMYWHTPPQPLLEGHIKGVIALLARALDVSLSEVDDLCATVRTTLDSMAFVRISKHTIHAVLEQLCDLLMERQPFGTTRNAKLNLSRMLRFILFTNLHRIGRFALMQSVSEAALRCIGHGDGRVRSEGKQLLAILTKVASTEQTQSLVRGFFRELHQMPAAGIDSASPSTSPGMLPAPDTLRRRRRMALLLALCSVLEASPGTVPIYVPRLMERLVAFGEDHSPEVSRAVKRTFAEWWRSHRDSWELEHKPHFTPAQIEVMAPLLTAPSYLV